MSRGSVAVVLASLLFVSVLIGAFAAAHSTGAPPSTTPAPSLSAAATPALTAIVVHTYDGEGRETADFCTGSCVEPFGPPPDYDTRTGGNTVLFTVIDTAADLTVNLTLNDPNATRDGLTNPVLSVTLPINQTTHESLYTNNRVSYTFPDSIVYGGGWNATASAPLGGSDVENLTLHTFALAAVTSPSEGSAVLPGETITLSWWVVSSVNDAPYTDFTSLTLWGSYTNVTVQPAFSPGLFPLPDKAVGTTTFTIPHNATALTDFDFAVSAVTNVSGELAGNETVRSYFAVGNLVFDEAETQASGDCPSYSVSSYSAGNSVFVYAVAGASAGPLFTGVPALPIGITFWNGEATVVPGGSPPSVLTTGADGSICFSFVADTPPFTLAYNYPFGNSVNLTVTDPAATGTGDWKAQSNVTFQLVPGSETGAVQVVLNATQYVPGGNVTATWTLGASNETALGTLSVSGWSLWSVPAYSVLGTGPITSTASSGTFTVTLPADLVGDFLVVVSAHGANGTYYGYAAAVAEEPTLVVNGPAYYTPGTTVSWGIQFAPAALAGTTTYYTVTGIWTSALGVATEEGVISQGTVGASNTVSVSVPSSGPASSYDLAVWAQTSTNGIYASSSAEADLETGYYVLVGVTTLSNYADGSYQPGQSITISWQVASESGLPLPNSFQVSVYIGAYILGASFDTTSSSGTVPLTIPSNTPTGALVIEVEVGGNSLVSGPGCYQESSSSTYGYCEAGTAIGINANPSVLSLELGAGSGLTVGWLILLVVILVVALLLVLLIRRGRSPPGPTPAYASPSEPLAPPAPPPSTPPAIEWKDGGATPGPSSDAPPPLPTPPQGPQ